MKKIKNMKELEAELLVLQSRKVQLEVGIRNEITSIREGMKPLKIAGRIISGLFKNESSHNDLLARGLGMGASKLSQKFLFSKLPSPLKKILSFVVGNVTSNLSSSKTTPIAEVLGGLIKNFFYEKSEELSPESRVTLP